MRKSLIKVIITLTLLLLASLFIGKFGGISILRFYIETGLGDCHNQPIFCLGPEEEINNPALDQGYISGLIQYKLTDLEIRLPKKFTVIKQETIKRYYKRRKTKYKDAVIYLLYEKPNFFLNLFPQLSKQGIKNDYEFITHTMDAKTKDIKNLNDAFFAIMKSIFTPDMGEQKNLKIVKFISPNKKGFITYNLSILENYFDCNLIDNEGNYFKLYIKDKPASLDLNQVLAIISTVKKTR